MSQHLQKDLDKLKKELLQLGYMIEKQITDAIEALNDRKVDLAENVIEQEELIDEKEVLIEEDCLKILALHQPVAMDLRFIVAVLKVNNDLERMGDLAANIAERSLYLTTEPPIPETNAFIKVMASDIRAMVKNSLDASVRLDVELARKVISMDNSVDDINRQMYGEFQNQVQKDPTSVKRALGLLSVSRYMERIADLATNIAEDVIFMVEGEVVRHKQ